MPGRNLYSAIESLVYSFLRVDFAKEDEKKKN